MPQLNEKAAQNLSALRTQKPLIHNITNYVVMNTTANALLAMGAVLVVTSLVLIAGFLVLAQSAFKLNADMGLLTAITIGFALLADFLFLPPLLMKVEK